MCSWQQLVIHEHEIPVNVYSYDQNNGYKCAKTVDAAVGYQVHRVDRSLS